MLHKLLSLAAVPVMLLMGSVAASADTSGTGYNMTVTAPSSATLIAKVAIPVTIQIQCSGNFDPSTLGFWFYYPPYYSSNATVTVSQAAGRSVNSATGLVNQALVCDGISRPYSVSLLANAPFRNGQAAITVSASWSEFVSGYSFTSGYTTVSASASASAQGPLTLSG